MLWFLAWPDVYSKLNFFVYLSTHKLVKCYQYIFNKIVELCELNYQVDEKFMNKKAYYRFFFIT